MRRVVVFLLLVCSFGLLVSGTAARHDAARAAPAHSVAVIQITKLPRLEDSFSEIRGHAGFWRIARTRDGVWWFLSPDNQTQFLNGVTTVRPQLRSIDPSQAAYRSSDWDGSEDLSRWAGLTARRVSDAGFKSLGAWCSSALHDCPLPMTQD